MFELGKSFHFNSSHTLEREIGTDSSRRIHGHSYRSEVALRGEADANGMVVDIGFFELALDEVRQDLTGRLLDDIADLGPATMENLCLWIWKRLQPQFPNRLYRVSVYRDSSGDACSYWGE